MRFVLCLLLSACSAPLNIAAAGDLQLSAERSQDPLAPLRQILVGDLRVVNLEGPLTDAPSKQLRGRPAQAAWLARRVDVASLANNHSDDAGAVGHADTVRALRAHGVVPLVDALTMDRRGHAIALFARSYAPDIDTDDALVSAVRSAAREHFVIVSLHWGHTGALIPSPAQRAFAAQLVDAGARVILGHGPHTPQGVELRGDAVIAYSLGNLSFDCDCTNERDAYALRVRFDGHERLRHVELVPLRAGLHDEPGRTDDAELRDLLRQLSSDLGTRFDRDLRASVPPTRGG